MEKKLSFTDQALNQINKITVGEDKKYFRITVQGGGCSGFKYSFGFDKKPNCCRLANSPNSSWFLVDWTFAKHAN